MKIDKLSVVVGGALLIAVVGYIIMQQLKVGPAAVKKNSDSVATPTNSVSASGSQPVTAASGNIVVDSPKANQTIQVVFEVKGRARVFENNLNYRVTDTNSNVLLEGSVLTNAKDAGQFGNFSFTISGITGKGQIVLQVFDYSAKDGAEIDKVIIPLNIN
jgi:hypothetical protein